MIKNKLRIKCETTYFKDCFGHAYDGDTLSLEFKTLD